MSFFTHLQCGLCSETFEPDRLWNLCPQCQRPLLARYDLEKARLTLPKEVFALATRVLEPEKSIASVAGAAFPATAFTERPNTLWRYHELLPVRDPKFRISLGEGFTPLICAERLGNEVGIENLYIKDDGLNPTGSFKARGMSVAVSMALELGAVTLSVPSAGNAAGAMSAYAALAGMEAHVFMPKDVPHPFIAECEALGANVTLIDGVITDCGRAAADANKNGDRFDVSTLREPYRLEGKKTMGYEIAEQMGWTLPDVIIYPTGGGTGLVGMWKAFSEMERLGWIDAKRPRMVAVQSTGCAPMVHAFDEGAEFAEPWEDAATVADGLRVPAAVGDFLILRALRESNGTAVSVTDESMIDGANLMGRTQGIFAAPEGGATVSGLLELRKRGWIKDGESVLLFNTGSGHKYSHLWAR